MKKRHNRIKTPFSDCTKYDMLPMPGVTGTQSKDSQDTTVKLQVTCSRR